MAVIHIEAPEDSFLDELAPSGPVAAGQRIAVFRSPVLERLDASLKAMQTHIEILGRPFTDGRIDEEIQMYNDKVAALTEALTENQKEQAIISDEVMTGAVARLELVKCNSAIATAKSTLLDAQITASQAVRKKNDLQEQINVASFKLQREAAFLQEMAASLSVNSPTIATFEPAVLLNSFLRKGHVVGTLTA